MRSTVVRQAWSMGPLAAAMTIEIGTSLNVRPSSVETRSAPSDTGPGRMAQIMPSGLPRFAVFASKAGADTNPDWFHNVKANPEARIEVGRETLDVVARVLDAEERAPIWQE